VGQFVPHAVVECFCDLSQLWKCVLNTCSRGILWISKKSDGCILP